jgi:hypothetical protein
MSGLAGRELLFRGGFVHGMRIEWDEETNDSHKKFPKDVYCLLVEGWGKPGSNKFDWYDVKKAKAVEMEPSLQDFFTARGLLNAYRALVAAMKEEGERLDEKRLRQLCFGEGGFGHHFEEVGVRLFLCHATVNKGHAPSKEFLWIEWSANQSYAPDSAQLLGHSGPGGSGLGGGCMIS